MTIDPQKMELWLNGEQKGPSTAPPKKGAKPDSARAADSDEEEPAAEAEAEGTLEEQFPTMFQLLEESGNVVEEALEELDADLLTDPETEYAANEDELSALAAVIDGLPDDVQEAMRAELIDLDHDKALEIAQALEAGQHIVDADKFAGFLFHASQVMAATAEDSEEEEEPAEEEEEPADDEDADPEELDFA